jgi:hypothetical protein
VAAVAGLAAPGGRGWPGQDWPRLPTVAGGPQFLSSSLLVWRRHGVGVMGLAGASCWCCGGAFDCARSLPVEVLRR